MVLICTSCQRAIKDAKSHLVKDHEIIMKNDDELKLRDLLLQSMNSFPLIHSLTLIRPQKGILVSEGYSCSMCGNVTKDRRNVRCGCAEQKLESSYYQTFQRIGNGLSETRKINHLVIHQARQQTVDETILANIIAGTRQISGDSAITPKKQNSFFGNDYSGLHLFLSTDWASKLSTLSETQFQNLKSLVQIPSACADEFKETQSLFLNFERFFKVFWELLV